MTDRVEADAIIEYVEGAERVQELHGSGIFYDTVSGRLVDIRAMLADELGAEFPARKVGTYSVRDIGAFVEYVTKHGLDETELWADRNSATVHAVIDAHGAAGTHAGWEDHDAYLKLEVDPDWQAFMARSGKQFQQTEFAEFIEDHLHCFAKPTAAEMLEMAQTFKATSKVDFESSHRVKSGETKLLYNEQTSAGAGKRGDMTIPDTFTVGLSPYKGIEPYAVEARFRYRIQGQSLTLGFKLVRPDKIVDDAFDTITASITQALSRPIWRT